MTIKVNVIMGGPSAEHEVSLNSGREVIGHLDTSKYDIRAVVITKNNDFYFFDYNGDLPDLKEFSDPSASARFSGPYTAVTSGPVWEGRDVAFLALHGAFGEDGVIQGFLDTARIRYTGSGVFASATAMNKVASKFLYIHHGLDTPPFSLYGKKYPLSEIRGHNLETRVSLFCQMSSVWIQ